VPIDNRGEHAIVETLVAQIVALLGVDAGTVQMVLTGLLDLARQSLGPDTGNALIAQIPGATEMMAGSLMGSGSMLSSLLGGGPDTTAGLVQLVADSGLAPDQVATIADMLLGYVQQTAGPGAADQLYDAIPALARLG
jgi:hypothetical protein